MADLKTKKLTSSMLRKIRGGKGGTWFSSSDCLFCTCNDVSGTGIANPADRVAVEQGMAKKITLVPPAKVTPNKKK